MESDVRIYHGFGYTAKVRVIGRLVGFRVKVMFLEDGLGVKAGDCQVVSVRQCWYLGKEA